MPAVPGGEAFDEQIPLEALDWTRFAYAEMVSFRAPQVICLCFIELYWKSKLSKIERK